MRSRILACAPCSGERTIQRYVTGLFKMASETKLVGERERRQFDDDAWRLAGIGDQLGDAFDRAGVGRLVMMIGV